MRKFLFTLIFCCCVAAAAQAQLTVIKGKVTDEVGEPLIGVTVTLKQNQQKTVTNIEGGFSISSKEALNVVVFTYLGFAPQEIPTKGTTTLSVKLVQVTSHLNEVVITALNISRNKASLGYSTQGVDPTEMTEACQNNITDLLDGKVSGLQIITSGSPTGSTKVQLRGANSLTGTNEPLWVVDGIPIDNTDSNGQIGNLDYGNNAGNLNPDDIESITVLKGPNAAALYGSKAANGAILVTMKKGKKNAGLGVSINSNYMQSQILQFPYYQNVYGEGNGGRLQGVLFGPVIGQQAVQAGSAGGRNWGAPLLGQPYYTFNGTLTTYNAHPDVVNDLFTKAGSYTQNVSFTQATEGANIRFSYTRNDATDVIQKENVVAKNNFQFSAGKDYASYLRVEARMSYLQEQVNNRTFRNEDPANPFNYFNNAVSSIPLSNLIPWKDANGNAFNSGGNGSIENPYWDINENANQDRTNRVIGGITLTFKLAKGLQFRAQESMDAMWGDRFNFIQKGSLSNVFGSYTAFQQSNKVFNTEGLFFYNNRFKKIYTLNANFGGNIRNVNYYNTSTYLNALAVHDVKNLSNNGGVAISNESPIRSRVYSIYGLASFGYKDFLYLDLTDRQDWSSTLPGEPYNYPSITSSFVFTQLWHIPQNILSFGKLRATYAKVGNDTSPYNLRSLFSYNSSFNGLPIVQFDQTYKLPTLKPEQTLSLEFGTELHFLNDRFSLDVSVYKTNSSNQITQVTVPQGTGFTNQFLNSGEIENRGIEGTLSGKIIKGKAFSWDATINVSSNRNKVLSLPNGLTSLRLGGAGGTSGVYAEVGQPIGVIRAEDQAYSSDGYPLVNPVTGYLYFNSNQKIGQASPKGLASFGSTFKYKDFSFNFLVSGRLGGQIYSATVFRYNVAGVSQSTLEGRDDYLFSDGVLGETDQERAGKTTLYNLNYPGAARPKGSLFPGYYPIVGTDGLPVRDANGNYIANLSAPNTRYINAQGYWQQTSHDGHLLVFDADYIKLKQVIIGYTLPASLLKRTVMKSVKLSAVGRNLWIILQRTPRGIDPESAAFSGNAQGLESGGALPYASYGFDLTITL